MTTSTAYTYTEQHLSQLSNNLFDVLTVLMPIVLGFLTLYIGWNWLRSSTIGQ